MVDGTLVMLASVVHEVVKYHRRNKRSSNKIRILEMKFKFEKKTNQTSVIFSQIIFLIIVIIIVIIVTRVIP